MKWFSLYCAGCGTTILLMRVRAIAGVVATIGMVAFSTPGEAFADRIYVPRASLIGGDSVGSTLQFRVHQAAIRLLSAAGHEVVSGAAAEAALSADATEACRRSGCLPSTIRSLTCDAGILLAIWDASSADRSVVTVAVVSPDGVVTRGAGRGPGAQIAAAVEQAIEEALSGPVTGAGPWLVVEGEPRGARLTVDAVDHGTIPTRVRVEGGSHDLRIEHADYPPQEHRVVVARTPQSELVFRVDLRPSSSGSSDGSSYGSSDSSFDGVLLGVGAGVTALGLGVFVPTLVRLGLGDRIDESTGTLHQADHGALVALASVGAGALVAGVTLVVLAFVGENSPQTLGIRLGPNGLSGVF